jgi:hypothetical protein
MIDFNLIDIRLALSYLLSLSNSVPSWKLFLLSNPQNIAYKLVEAFPFVTLSVHVVRVHTMID